MNNYMQGRFAPRHPEKYKGNPTTIFYRSGWELKLMSFLDLHEDVLEWSSEEIRIPYRDPANGNKMRTYYPDFYIMKRNSAGVVERLVAEVKPKSQTNPPLRKAKVTKRYIREALAYATNSSKFQAASLFCQKRGWKFVILTESDLNV